MTGDDFIALAERLALAPSPDEAGFRTAVSRAYYGAFHLAIALLRSAGLSVTEGPSAHGVVPRELKECGHADARTAGSILEDLHPARRKADYYLSDTDAGTKLFAGQKIAEAKRIRAAVNACDTPTVRTKIKAGVETYRAKIAPPRGR